MLPKVQAALQFAGSARGRLSLITELNRAADGIAGKTGTVVRG
jgi:carbamate kinase